MNVTFCLEDSNTDSWDQKIIFQVTYQSRQRTDFYITLSAHNECFKIITTEIKVIIDEPSS